MIHLQEPVVGSSQLPHLPQPLQAPVGLLDHMGQLAEQPTQLFGSLGKWAKVKYPNKKYIASKIQIGPLGAVPLLFFIIIICWLQE